MRTIRTSTGIAVDLDGDLMALMEVLYHEVTAKRELERSFEDMNREIATLIAQMTTTDLRRYLQEALFVNTVTFENQRAAAYIARVGGRPTRAPARPAWTARETRSTGAKRTAGAGRARR